MGKPLVTWLLYDYRCRLELEVVVRACDQYTYEAFVIPLNSHEELGIEVGSYATCYEAAFSYVSRFYGRH